MLTALLAGLAAAAALGRPRVGSRRLGGLPRAAGWPVVARSSPADRRSQLGPVAACALAGAALAAVLGVPVGLLLGAAVAGYGPTLVRRLEPQSARDRRRRRDADLPLALDLLAACLAGGAFPAAAAATVAAAVGGPCGERFAAVAAALQVGTPAADAWRRLADDDAVATGVGPASARDVGPDPFAATARALARASEGGVPVAAAVARLAADARARAAARSEQAARRVGVLVVAPLGLCFLPAFVLLGVVPVVAGLAGPLLSTW